MKIAYTIKDEEKKIEISPDKDGWEVVWKNWNTVKPLFDCIMIIKDEERKKTAGGIVIPDSIKERPSTGTVIAVGEGAIDPHTGNLIPMKVSVGDRVIFPKLAGQLVKINDEERTILKQTDILGIIE